MKRIVLFALLFAAVAAAGHAQALKPQSGVRYKCTYTKTVFNEVNPGWSIFTLSGDDQLLRGIEDYQAQTSTGKDNRKATFAKPFDIIVTNPHGEEVLRGTRWELTINPSGPQCTNTVIRPGGRIEFGSCSDGHSRVCTPG